MGFFSWECPECGYSITADSYEGFEWQNMAMCQLSELQGDMFKDNPPLLSPFAAQYDGYGRFFDDDLIPERCRPLGEEINLANYREVRLYHRACWLAAGCPTPLKISPNAKDQGYFLGEDPRPDPFENPLDSLKSLVDTPLEELPLLIPRVEKWTSPLKRLYEGLINGTVSPEHVRHLWDRSEQWPST